MSEFTAVVTGGNKGIGADLVERLLGQGYTVVSVARTAPEKSHPNLHSVEADLLDAQAVAAAAGTIAAEFDVTHLIHNAGLIWPNLVEDAKPEDITGLAQLHLGSALTLLQAALPNMKARQFGRVMFNASRAALGAPTRTAYSASKAGMIGMARTWALELAPQQEALAKRIPVGRIGNVRDVTNAFLFFCDPENSFVTGQTLYVCGGASVGTLTI
jgi:NAD(P)-dependent dehydrogenase (short-subunit alcohol dehydrogenase family)